MNVPRVQGVGEFLYLFHMCASERERESVCVCVPMILYMWLSLCVIGCARESVRTCGAVVLSDGAEAE